MTLQLKAGASPPKHKGSSRKLIFDKDKFEKIGKIYELKLDVKITENGADGADGADPGSIGMDNYVSEKEGQ